MRGSSPSSTVTTVPLYLGFPSQLAQLLGFSALRPAHYRAQDRAVMTFSAALRCRYSHQRPGHCAHSSLPHFQCRISLSFPHSPALLFVCGSGSYTQHRRSSLSSLSFLTYLSIRSTWSSISSFIYSFSRASFRGAFICSLCNCCRCTYQITLHRIFCICSARFPPHTYPLSVNALFSIDPFVYIYTHTHIQHAFVVFARHIGTCHYGSWSLWRGQLLWWESQWRNLLVLKLHITSWYLWYSAERRKLGQCRALWCMCRGHGTIWNQNHSYGILPSIIFKRYQY